VHQNAPKRTTFSTFRPPSLGPHSKDVTAFTSLAINASLVHPELIEGPVLRSPKVARNVLALACTAHYIEYQTISKLKRRDFIHFSFEFFAGLEIWRKQWR